MDSKTYVMVDLDMLVRAHDHATAARSALFNEATMGNKAARAAMNQLDACLEAFKPTLAAGYAVRSQNRLVEQAAKR